jgi:hypothetical protein
MICQELCMDQTRGSLAQSGTYRIGLDAAWSLNDLYELPHVLEQVYAFNCVFLLAEQTQDPEKLIHTFSSYPWRGGYSAVNFYRVLRSQVPQRLRPTVRSMQYASPGWIELSLLVPSALLIGQMIDVFISSAGKLNALYTEIHKGLTERKLMRIDLKHKELDLAQHQIDFATRASEQFAKELGFQNLNQLNELTGNPVSTLKILLSYYRRVRTLAEYVAKGKAKFPSNNDDDLSRLN